MRYSFHFDKHELTSQTTLDRSHGRNVDNDNTRMLLKKT